MARSYAARRLGKALAYICLYGMTLFLLFPLFWMIMTSFKPQAEWVSYPPTWLPTHPTLGNYLFIILGSAGHFFSSYPGAAIPYLNTLIVAVASTLAAVAIGILGAYSLSRFHGTTSSLISIIMPRMFPPMAMIIPMIIFFQIIGAIDTYWGLIIVYIGFTLPYSVLMLKGFMDGVPKEFTEAAMLDGLSTWEVLFKVWVPTIKNGLMTTMLFLLILNWTEYTFASVLASRKVETLTIALAKLFSNEAGTYYGPQAALGILAAIPTVVFGLYIHKHLAYGFTFGALKR
jgi:multiple sugar transport system permease protein